MAAAAKGVLSPSARGLREGAPWRILGTVVALPELNQAGDLPAGVHQAFLSDVIARFGEGSMRRRAIGDRLRRIYRLAGATGHIRRFIVFGSFISEEPSPNDVDVFLLMDDRFDAGALEGEAAILFSHLPAQAYFGASVFWLRRLAALEGEDATVEHWQMKRDGTRRGIVEVMGQ